MPIDVRCPSCNASLPAPDEFVGKKIRCADCNGIVDVPAAVAPAVARPALARPVTPRPAAQKPAEPADDADAPRRRKPKAEWDDDDKPAKGGPKPGVLTGAAVAWLVIVGALGLTGAGVLAFAAVPAAAPAKNPNPPVAMNDPPPVVPVPVPPAGRPFVPFNPADVPRIVMPRAGPGPMDVFETLFPVRIDGASAGLIKKHADDLRAGASSESGGKWGIAALFDGDGGSSWFSAPGNGGVAGDPWVMVAFPEDVTVTKVEILGNRERNWDVGYTVLAGRVEYLDKAGKILRSEAVTPSAAGGKDFLVTTAPAVAGVRAVKFVSTVDERNNKYIGLGEMLVE